MLVKKELWTSSTPCFSYELHGADLVHKAVKLTVAVNALMHQEMMNHIKSFLTIFSGYSGRLYCTWEMLVFYVLKRDSYQFKTIYNCLDYEVAKRIRQVNSGDRKLERF